MDAAQLKAAILEAVPLRDSLSTVETEAACAVYSAAVKELYRRDGEDALEWAASDLPTGLRPGILSDLMKQMAVDSPDLMKTWADRFRGEYGERWAKQCDLSAVIGAAGRGAAELLRVRELLSTVALPNSASSYPADFDFQLLVTGSAPVWTLEEPVSYWAARDKEDSWEGVKHVVESMPGKGTNLVGHVFNGVRAMEGEEKAAGWMVGKLGELHPQLRRRAIQQLFLAEVGTEGTVALIRGFPDPADKMALVSSQLRSFLPSSSVAALKALESPQLQAEVLMDSVAATGGTGPAAERNRAFFISTMAQLQLDPQARQRIMEALSAPPSR
ncbi:MAG: hypothetical protein EOP88_14605 [Verrucomicrobiaceae bacterium]|nr:MAG: hypothetical protein EOP88_14605 [Verrucomicrobiaceae bacterium]